jgi:hypothetical protein
MKPIDDKSPRALSKFPKFADVLHGDGIESEAAESDGLDDIEFDDLDEDFELSAEVLPTADMRPNPVELPAPINPEGGRKQSVETHRNLFCLHYDNCLDEAVKRSWNSFSCVRCGFYRTNRGEEEGGTVERFATQRRAS